MEEAEADHRRGPLRRQFDAIIGYLAPFMPAVDIVR